MYDTTSDMRSSSPDMLRRPLTTLRPLTTTQPPDASALNLIASAEAAEGQLAAALNDLRTAAHLRPEADENYLDFAPSAWSTIRPISLRKSST